MNKNPVSRCPYNHAVWQIDTTIALGGRRYKHLKKVGYKTMGEALADFSRLKAEIIQNNGSKPSGASFEGLYARYIANYSIGVKVSTAHNELLETQKWILRFFEGKPISSVFTFASLSSWRAWLAEEGAGRQRINKSISRMKEVATFAYDVEMLTEKDLRVVNQTLKKAPMEITEKKEVVVWTKEEAASFMASFDETDKWVVFFEFAFYTGCRIGELIGMQWKDIDQVNKTWRVRQSVSNGCGVGKGVVQAPKTNASKRTMPLSDGVLASLLQLRVSYPGTAEDDFVFFCGKTPIGKTTITRAYKAHIKLSGVRDTRFHAIRHYRNTELLGFCHCPEDVKAVDQWLGRDTTSVTLGAYFHTSDDAIKSISRRNGFTEQKEGMKDNGKKQS